MDIFFADLGSERFGWAYRSGGQLISAGTWHLTSKRHESHGMRWLELQRHLQEVIEVSRYPIDIVGFEEVKSHTGRRPKKVGKGTEAVMFVDAAHAYGAARAFLLAWCAKHGLEHRSVTIQDIKSAATGRRGGKGTDKATVKTAAEAKWPTIAFNTDDASDAAWGCCVLESLYGHLVAPNSVLAPDDYRIAMDKP